MKTELCTRMDEELQKEEKARQMVQNDFGSGSTVCSDASTAVGKGPSGTFARPPPGIGIRLKDFFMPRKMEFKGWVTDNKQCSYQGLTDDRGVEISSRTCTNIKSILIGIKPGLKQGTWPTKTIVRHVVQE